MKDWVIVFSCIGFFTVALGMAVLDGANAVQKDAAAAAE